MYKILLRIISIIFIITYLSINITQADMLFPIDLVDQIGTSSDQPLSVLATKDQAGSQDNWSRYVEFTPAKKGGYQGILMFNNPNPASSTTALTVYANYRGPKKREQQWSLSIYNVEQNNWLQLVDNSQAKAWQWTLLQQAVPENLSAFIDQQGKIKLLYSTNSNVDNSQLDYIGLNWNDSGSTPTQNQQQPQPDPSNTQNQQQPKPQPDPSDNNPPTNPLPPENTVGSEKQWWQPSPGLSWQIQYTGTINTTLPVKAFNLDVFDVSAGTINQLHSQGTKVICYFSAGSYEDWRPDANQFPAAVKGNNLDGWPGEQWLDVRRLDLLLPIMNSRLDLAVQKGCDAVDPDNVDGYTNKTGFPLKYQDQINYNVALANAAHLRGLAISLKNDLDQISDLVDHFDFATNEQCFQYNECNMLLPFIQSGKPVLEIEYNIPTSKFCPQANSMNFDALAKKLELDAWREVCR